MVGVVWWFKTWMKVPADMRDWSLQRRFRRTIVYEQTWWWCACAIIMQNKCIPSKTKRIHLKENLWQDLVFEFSLFRSDPVFRTHQLKTFQTQQSTQVCCPAFEVFCIFESRRWRAPSWSRSEKRWPKNPSESISCPRWEGRRRTCSSAASVTGRTARTRRYAPSKPPDAAPRGVTVARGVTAACGNSVLPLCVRCRPAAPTSPWPRSFCVTAAATDGRWGWMCLQGCRTFILLTFVSDADTHNKLPYPTLSFHFENLKTQKAAASSFFYAANSSLFYFLADYGTCAAGLIRTAVRFLPQSWVQTCHQLSVRLHGPLNPQGGTGPGSCDLVVKRRRFGKYRLSSCALAEHIDAYLSTWSKDDEVNKYFVCFREHHLFMWTLYLSSVHPAFHLRLAFYLYYFLFSTIHPQFFLTPNCLSAAQLLLLATFFNICSL